MLLSAPKGISPSNSPSPSPAKDVVGKLEVGGHISLGMGIENADDCVENSDKLGEVSEAFRRAISNTTKLDLGVIKTAAIACTSEAISRRLSVAPENTTTVRYTYEVKMVAGEEGADTSATAESVKTLLDNLTGGDSPGSTQTQFIGALREELKNVEGVSLDADKGSTSIEGDAKIQTDWKKAPDASNGGDDGKIMGLPLAAVAGVGAAAFLAVAVALGLAIRASRSGKKRQEVVFKVKGNNEPSEQNISEDPLGGDELFGGNCAVRTPVGTNYVGAL